MGLLLAFSVMAISPVAQIVGVVRPANTRVKRAEAKIPTENDLGSEWLVR